MVSERPKLVLLLTTILIGAPSEDEGVSVVMVMLRA